jgi:HSP20 family protein
MTKLAKHTEIAERKLAPLATRMRPWLWAHSLLEDIEGMFRGGPWWPPFARSELVAEMPPVDVFEEGDAVVVKAELPGLAKDEIEVEVAGDAVTISGKKEKEEKVEKKDYYRHERAAAEFSRSIALPVEVELEKATAKLEDGVLEVRLTKRAGAAPKAKKITVA